MKITKGIGFPVDIWSAQDWKDFYHGLKWAANQMVARRLKTSAMVPTYYVRHPDETYSVADPQPSIIG